MCPEKAKVVYIEDDKNFRKTVVGILEDAGHIVVATADTLAGGG